MSLDVLVINGGETGSVSYFNLVILSWSRPWNSSYNLSDWTPI